MAEFPSVPLHRNPQVPQLTTDQIYTRLTLILQEVFDNDDLVARPELDAAQVEGWDSMGNVRLFLAIEQDFGVRFGAGEISEIQNVGELAALITRKL
jgi:acyl carrier protein